MKYILSIILIAFGLSFNSSYADERDDKLEKIWKNFLEIVSNKNCDSFIRASLEKIYCYMCLENTDEEYRELNEFRKTEVNWYRKLYEEKIYLSSKRFCQDDLEIIFNKKFLYILESSETKFMENEMNGKKYVEVLVTTTRPGEVAPMHEGGQHHFRFRKIGDLYKFGEISTIP